MGCRAEVPMFTDWGLGTHSVLAPPTSSLTVPGPSETESLHVLHHGDVEGKGFCDICLKNPK